MVSPLSRMFTLGALVGCVVAALATTTVKPPQALQTGKNLIQYFVPGSGWFVDANTATLLTKATAQSGVCDFVASSNGTSGYTYTGFGAAGCQALTAYTKGMHLRLVVDVTNAVGHCSLAIDQINIGTPVAIKDKTGKNDPAASLLVPGQEYPIWFDGTVFRLE
jgi:hypothetical protein